MLKICQFKLKNRYVHQSYVLVLLAVGIIAGAILGLIFRIKFFDSPVWLILVAIIFLAALLKPHYFCLVLTFVAGLILAFNRISSELISEDYIKTFYDQTVIVTGTIDGDPESDEANTKIKLRDLKFGENAEMPSAGSLYVTTRTGPNVNRTFEPSINQSANSSSGLSGDQATGQAHSLVSNNDQTFKQGDEITLKGKMLAGFGTYAGYLWHPEILQIKRPSPSNLIIQARDFLAARIQRELEPKAAGLGLSYLLGMKANLDNDLAENLRIIGLVHIVVASGAHLAILVEVAKKLFGRISRFAGLLFAALFIGFFMVMVGFTPSILRAGIMSLLTLLVGYAGRQIAPWRIIILVAAITLMINPMFLTNLGWLLSFASFAGIMILGPKLTQFFYHNQKPNFVAATILTTLSATLLTLPITLYFYGTFSLISVVANLIILPTLPYAMGLTFLAGVLADVPGLHFITSFLATKMLDFHIITIDFFSSLKSFLIEILPYNYLVFLIYLVIVVPVLIKIVRPRQRVQKVLK